MLSLGKSPQLAEANAGEYRLAVGTGIQKTMRPASHQIGDVGRNAVERVFLEAGWVVNSIASDYGEDLAVQPTAAGLVEKYRIYVQVKTVSSASRRRVRLASENVFLWQFLPTPFILVCWHEPRQQPLYLWINEERRPEKFASSETREVSFALKDMRLLDSKQMQFLSSEARNRFYEETLGRLSDFIDRGEGYRPDKRKIPRAVREAKLASARIACHLLAQDGIFIRKGSRFHASEQVLADIPEIMRQARARMGRLPQDSVDWALEIVTYVWRKKYDHQPSPILYWALVNAVEVVISSQKDFQALLSLAEA